MAGGVGYSVVRLPGVVRLVATVVPASEGGVHCQAVEVIARLQALLAAQGVGMCLTAQTVFLRHREDRAVCERLFRECFGPDLPVTSFVDQPPCGGEALAVEACAIGGPDVTVERHTPCTLSVSYGGMRWIQCAGVEWKADRTGAHAQAMAVLEGVKRELRAAGSGWGDVVRTWFYLGDITGVDAEGQRYAGLNRARSEWFDGIRFGRTPLAGRKGAELYPASTGIGAAGCGLGAGCLALQASQPGVRLVPMENPGQTPAYCYAAHYSPHSPKFSRAMAVLLGDYATTWISGTASILNAESMFLGDIERQTDQALDNIERLLTPENFAWHGVSGAGATLADLAEVRVYVKRPEDYPRCRAVCERRLAGVPSIYTLADICRPELLVEIEGVAFSPLNPAKAAGQEEGQ
jgi:enamine deaminase RidA (YjgF/YER057c/UK114 family)